MDGMREKGTTEPAGLSERPQEAGGDKSAGGPPPQRFSAKRKLRAVSRLLRGEPLELVARELNVRAARLSEWRERALLAAEAALEERERDGRDDEIARLKGKVGEVSSCSPSSMRATQPTIMLAGSHVGMLYGWHAW